MSVVQSIRRTTIDGWIGIIPLIIVMAAGTSFLMWMGEQLTDKGIGNGISLIIFAGILIRLPIRWAHFQPGLDAFRDQWIKALSLIGDDCVDLRGHRGLHHFRASGDAADSDTTCQTGGGQSCLQFREYLFAVEGGDRGVIPIIFAISRGDAAGDDRADDCQHAAICQRGAA